MVSSYISTEMLVMAIENARQLANENRRITEYHIKEAIFHKTLMISISLEDVETQLYIQSSKDAFNKHFASSDFRVCIYEDDQWAENCREIIEMKYEKAETEIDRGKEAAKRSRCYKQRYENAVEICNKIVESERMYEHLQKIGLTFGSAFRPTSYSRHASLGHLGRWLRESFPPPNPIRLAGPPAPRSIGHLPRTPTRCPLVKNFRWRRL